MENRNNMPHYGIMDSRYWADNSTNKQYTIIHNLFLRVFWVGCLSIGNGSTAPNVKARQNKTKSSENCPSNYQQYSGTTCSSHSLLESLDTFAPKDQLPYSTSSASCHLPWQHCAMNRFTDTISIRMDCLHLLSNRWPWQISSKIKKNQAITHDIQSIDIMLYISIDKPMFSWKHQ